MTTPKPQSPWILQLWSNRFNCLQVLIYPWKSNQISENVLCQFKIKFKKRSTVSISFFYMATGSSSTLRKVSFSVSIKLKSLTLGAGQTIIYDAVLTNDGSGYDERTGVSRVLWGEPTCLLSILYLHLRSRYTWTSTRLQ